MSLDEAIVVVKRVALMCGKTTLTKQEYDKYGKFHSTTLVQHIGKWNTILAIVGMKANVNRGFTNEELFEEIERVWVLLGRQPTTTDIKNGVSKYSLQSYARRFGGWRAALQAFVNYIDSDIQREEDIEKDKEQKQEDSCNVVMEVAHDVDIERKQHTTPREINLRTRFKVFQRDKFRCCICGASPATDPSVELHIDHIIPWSKGGETVIENLQTLCSKCNIGKSDLLMEKEQKFTVLQIQEDDYGCEERPADAKKTVLVRLKDAEENERMVRQEDDWLYEQGIDEGDWVVFAENRLYKKKEER